MCAIIGSFSLQRLKKLIELNSYRGVHSHSVSRYTLETIREPLRVIKKGFGAPDLTGIDECGDYFIAHIQAPTTEAKDEDSIHPAALDNALLWHNGILKPDTIEYLQDKHRAHHIKWDTELLLYDLVHSAPWDDLSNIDGSFSCLFYEFGYLYLFRNEISPMFYHQFNFDISSSKFDGSIETDPNIAWEFDPFRKELKEVGRFTTMQNPYFLGDV